MFQILEFKYLKHNINKDRKNVINQNKKKRLREKL